MRVLCISQDFRPNCGGIAVFLDNLCTQLARLGHEVDVLTPARYGCTRLDAGLPYGVLRCRIPGRFSSWPLIQNAISLHLRRRYDLVLIGHFMTAHALGALFLRRLCGLPYVILTHGNDLSAVLTTPADKLMARLILEGAGMIMANSHFTAELVRAGGYRGPTLVLNPGVDIDVFHPGAEAPGLDELYKQGGARVLLTTARLVRKKNVHGVLRALPRVREVVPQVVYVIAGDGEERGRLQGLAQELGVSDHVRFLGHVPDDLLPALYCASDLFVMPSLEMPGDIEGFGIAFAEASACSVPIVASRTGGIGEAVLDGETGLLVDARNVDDISNAIVRILTERDLARCLGNNGRRWVEQNLTWEKVGLRFEEASLGIVRG